MDDVYEGVREDGGIDGLEPAFVDVDGTRTRHYDIGDGEPIVLVHGGNWGGTSSANTWSAAIEHLRDDFRLLAFDRIGCGMTDNPEAPEDFRYAAEVDHALAYLDAVGIDRCHLVGFSRGAGLASRMAVEEPDRFRALGLTNSATLGPPAGDGRYRHDRLYRMGDLGLEPTDPAYVRYLLEQYSYRTDYITEERCRTAAYMASREKARRTAEVMEGGQIETWRDTLETHMRLTRRRIADGVLTMPVLYVYGRNDLTVRLGAALGAVDLLGRTNPDVRLKLITGCGHMVFLEHPREFARTVSDFVGFWAQ